MVDAGKVKRRRFRFQYRLRTLLLLTVVFALFMSWFSSRMQQARRQREAIETLHRIAGDGACVQYEGYDRAEDMPYTYNPRNWSWAPGWLWDLLGDDFFVDVVSADIQSGPADGSHLKCLRAFPRLKELQLWYRAVPGHAIRELAGITSLEVLSVGGSMALVADDFAFLERLPRLKSLELNVTGISDAGLAHLRGLTRLESLDLSHNPITDAGLVNLRGLVRLRTLNLAQDHEITDAGLANLAGLPNLEELNLSEIFLSRAGRLPNLARLTGLKTLNLSQNEVRDEAFDGFETLSRLESLDLDCTSIGGEGLRHVGAIKSLRKLGLGNSHSLQCGWMRHLAGLSNLESLDLSFDEVTDDGLRHLENLVGLQSLCLSYTQVTDDGLRHFSRLVNLETLWLNYTKVRGRGLEYLLRLPRLHMLFLAGAKLDASALPYIRRLKSKPVNVWADDVPDAGAPAGAPTKPAP
jgi:hypothetical protein